MIIDEKVLTKEFYAKCLITKLDLMLGENQKAKAAYNALKKKQNTKNYFEFVKSLSESERDVFHKGGKVYSKAAIQRIRIELNKVLIELEKEM